MKRRWPWIVGLLLLCAGGLGLLFAEPGSGDGASDGRDAAPGAVESEAPPGAGGGRVEPRWLDTPAPGVAFETLAGDTASLEEYRGRIVLLNFWGTWCPPCRREIPELIEVGERFSGDGVVVIGVAVDSGSPEEIRAFLEDFGAEYPIWVSSGRKALAHFEAAGYPYTVLIDEEGRIRKRYLGPQTAELLGEHIRALMSRRETT